MRNEKNMGSGSPEDLHKKGQSTSKKAVDKFVNPGTPTSALVSESDLEQAQVSPAATAKLRSNLTGMQDV